MSHTYKLSGYHLTFVQGPSGYVVELIIYQAVRYSEETENQDWTDFQNQWVWEIGRRLSVMKYGSE